MNKKFQFLGKWLAGWLFFGLMACTDQLDTWNRGLLLGETRATISGQNVSFTINSNISAEDANGYTAFLKYLSIYRRSLPPNSASLHIRVTKIDLDAISVPFTMNENARVTISTANNTVYEGKSGDITFTIHKKSGDILEGTFSGTLSNVFDPNEKISLQNGEFKIKIDRF